MPYYHRLDSESFGDDGTEEAQPFSVFKRIYSL